MNKDESFGFAQNPANGLGIIRARTLIGNLKLWDFPRSEKALDIIISEVGVSPLPGIYLLFDERSIKKVYVGQSENLKSRLLSHMKQPDDKIKNWSRAFIINDGRNATQSDLNDENIRLVLEDYLVRLFKLNRYSMVTSSTRLPSLSSHAKIISDRFKNELNVMLTSKSKITKLITEKRDNEIYLDDAKTILVKNGYKINKWGSHETIINSNPTFVRPGSKKEKGWQVTFRGAKHDSFKSFLSRAEGYLLMPRGPILLIPLKEIYSFIVNNDKDAFSRDTIDIFIKFDDTTILLHYKKSSLDVTHCAIKPYN